MMAVDQSESWKVMPDSLDPSNTPEACDELRYSRSQYRASYGGVSCLPRGIMV